MLFRADVVSAEDIAARLDAAGSGICVRPGFHCAALAHRTLGTPEGGAVRASFGWFNTRRDAEQLIQSLRGGLPGRNGLRGVAGRGRPVRRMEPLPFSRRAACGRR